MSFTGLYCIITTAKTLDLRAFLDCTQPGSAPTPRDHPTPNAFVIGEEGFGQTKAELVYRQHDTHLNFLYKADCSDSTANPSSGYSSFKHLFVTPNHLSSN